MGVAPAYVVNENLCITLIYVSMFFRALMSGSYQYLM